jgi:hypothetical protein
MPIAKLKYVVTNGNLATRNFAPCPKIKRHCGNYTREDGMGNTSSTDRMTDTRTALTHCGPVTQICIFCVFALQL